MNSRIVFGAGLAALGGPAMAHGFAGGGWVHPLTGLDHMLAMVAVGLWSAQLGGHAIWKVPAAFVLAMAAGSAIGLRGGALIGIEMVIAASVLVLGAAIAMRSRLGWPVAALASFAFGLAHGYVHGLEMPQAGGLGHAAGFLVTTAALHAAGAVGALLLLDHPEGGRRLRAVGALVALAGGFLLQGAV